MNYYSNNNGERKQNGYCVKIIKEICCYPSYYNEDRNDQYNDNCNNNHRHEERRCNCNNWQNDDKNDYDNDCCKQHKRHNCCWFRNFNW